MGRNPLVIHYPGIARHPAGEESGLSWFSDLGKGWLRIRSERRFLAFPLHGRAVEPEALGLPVRGVRGQPRSLDLWLAVAAVLRPEGITTAEFTENTGSNAFNISKWVTTALQTGRMVVRSSLTNKRMHRYQLAPAGIPAVCEFIRSCWPGWRRGEAIERLRPTLRYYVAHSEWPALAKQAEGALTATSITFLEGHDGGRRLLSGGGNIPQLAYLCAASQWKQLEASQHIVSRQRRERPDDSEATILADDHPILRMIASRTARKAPGDVTPTAALHLAWPYGLRALCAIENPAPRVREAAEGAWKSWVRNTLRDVEAAWGQAS